MDEASAVNHIVIPPAKALELAARAGKIYLRNCGCRVRQQACPPDQWEVCLYFEHASPDDLREARPITTEQALSVLRTSAERNLIYQLFYRQSDHRLTEICSCCTCCCRPLLRLKRDGNYSDALRSDWLAVTDPQLCSACGTCEESCFFGARQVEEGELRLDEERCFGCGRCLGSCPEGAIRLEAQPGRGIPIPTGD